MVTAIQTSQVTLGSPSDDLFTKEEILATGDKLDALLRKHCVKNKITVQEFYDRFMSDAESQKLPMNKRQWTYTNLLRAIKAGNVTKGTFERTLQVLGFRIEDLLVITVREGCRMVTGLLD